MTRPLLHRAGALLVATALATAPTATLASRGEREEEHHGRRNAFRNIPVTGTIAGAPFDGFVDITGFTSAQDELGNNAIYAVGVLRAPGHDPLPIWTPVQLPGQSGLKAAAPISTQQATGSCSILNLTLAPIHLDLLGLVVDIPNQIVLNLVAEQGPGNLLGNLLCAITGILDGLDLGGLLTNVLTNVLTNLLNSALGLP